MATCPACGIEVGAESGECPHCHLSATLFSSVREAAGPSGAADPAYLRTIGELLATVDLAHPAERDAPPVLDLFGRPARYRFTDSDLGPPTSPSRQAAPIEPIRDLPPAPLPYAPLPEIKHRLEEYFRVGRRLGLDFTDFESRASSAALVDDLDSLEVLAREMFVHLTSSIAEEYEAALGRRNELAQLIPTTSADVELTAVRRAIGVGDLGGAQRRLTHVRDELGRIQEQWEVGRILVAEGELMLATIRELGGDASVATGPLEEGRKLFAAGRRTDAERVLARAAVALWTVLQPLLLAELRRLRDRMMEERAAGLDIEPGVHELRAVAEELRKRNFVGTIVSYRRLKFAVDRTAPPGIEAMGPADATAEVRPSPPA